MALSVYTTLTTHTSKRSRTGTWKSLIESPFLHTIHRCIAFLYCNNECKKLILVTTTAVALG